MKGKVPMSMPTFSVDFGVKTTAPHILVKKRSTVEIASHIEWSDKKGRAAFAFRIKENGELVDQDVVPCENIESPCQLDLVAIPHVLGSIPIENLVTIKMTELSVVNGINRDVDFWSRNGWLRKNGEPIKCRELWEKIYYIKQQRRMIAVPLEDREAKKLQNASRALISQFLKD
jgi:ribonuclease HI